MGEGKLSTQRASLRLWTVATLILFFALLVWTEPTALLSPVPAWINWLAGPCGFAGGAWLVIRARALDANSRKSSSNGWFAMASLPVLAIFAGTFVGRSIFELAAYAAWPASAHMEPVRISGSLTGRAYGYRVSGLGMPGGREVRLFVTEAIDDQIIAVSPPVWRLSFDALPYCVMLPVQQGRWRTLRASVPPIWGRPLDQLIPCPSLKRDRAAKL